MIEISGGHVYEKIEVNTGTQVAIVMTSKCAEHKVKLSFSEGVLSAQFKDWQDNDVSSADICTIYVKDELAGVTVKHKIPMVDGICALTSFEPSEYTITATVTGADGDSIFVDLT